MLPSARRARVPFDGQTAAELYDKHRSAEVPMDPVPEPLRPIIARGMAKDPRYRPADAARLAAELRDAATDSYGEEWEDRGRSHLAEAALLLLALLWPSGSAPAQGITVAKTPLTGPATEPASPAQQAGAGHPQLGRPQLRRPQPSREARYRWHLRHILHEEHLARLRHTVHLEHVEHLEHLDRLRSLGGERGAEDGGPGERPGEPRDKTGKRPRSRLHLAAAAGAAVVVTVVAALTAVALTSHGSSGPAGSATGPGGSSSVAAHATTGAGGSGSPGYIGSGHCWENASDANLIGTAALPVNATSVAASVRQQASSCYGTPISRVTATCGYPYTFSNGDISYTCTIGDQPTTIYVDPANGNWIDEN